MRQRSSHCWISVRCRSPSGQSLRGRQQRVAIARALLAKPRLLLMDEPLAALDEQRKAEFLPGWRRCTTSSTSPVLYVSHALPEVARLADHLLLERGRVRAEGRFAELLPRLDLLSHGEGSFRRDRGNGRRLTMPTTRSPSRLCRAVALGSHAAFPELPCACASRHDVSLALAPMTIQHPQYACDDNSTGGATSGRVLAGLDIGSTALLARVTKRSSAFLGLTRGKTLQAQIKSVALLD